MRSSKIFTHAYKGITLHVYVRTNTISFHVFVWWCLILFVAESCCSTGFRCTFSWLWGNQCFLNFRFYYHRLWWSSWHAMVAFFSYTYFWFGYFSLRDLFQVTGTDASCVLYIICPQFILFEPVTLCSSYCVSFVALLASPYAVLLRTWSYSLFVFGSIWIQFSEFSLSCAEYPKLALRTVIMSFHRCLSLLLRLKVIASI